MTAAVTVILSGNTTLGGEGKEYQRSFSLSSDTKLILELKVTENSTSSLKNIISLLEVLLTNIFVQVYCGLRSLHFQNFY
jgi:hypothetical protein